MAPTEDVQLNSSLNKELSIFLREDNSARNQCNGRKLVGLMLSRIPPQSSETGSHLVD